jgi:hypothetical protein
MPSWTYLTTTARTTVTGGTWNDTVPNLAIRLDHGLGVTLHLPSREADAARLLNNLIEQAQTMLATIPDHHQQATDSN